jgi:hypothetical protein
MNAYVLIMFSFTMFLAVIHANHDAATFRFGNDIVHWKEWINRAAHVLSGALILYFPLEIELVPAILSTLMCAPAFSLAFRSMLNCFTKHSWWYMGPLLRVRTKKDSRYDGWYHKAAWMLTGRKYSNGVSQTYPIKLPFYLAVMVEVLFTLALLCAALVIC